MGQTPEELAKSMALEMTKDVNEKFEQMKVQMKRIEQENADLRMAEQLSASLRAAEKKTLDSEQASRSKPLASRIQDAGSFSSIVKQLDFSEPVEDFASMMPNADDAEIDLDKAAPDEVYKKILEGQADNMKFSLMMAREMSRMQGFVNKISGAPSQIAEVDRGCYVDSPFIASIAAVDIPKKYSMPIMNMYDGSGDPNEHVAEYKQRSYSIPIAIREAVMCKSIGSTLRGPALKWLTNVPNNTIRSFSHLVNMFNL